jgi:hypothetical protein
MYAIVITLDLVTSTLAYEYRRTEKNQSRYPSLRIYLIPGDGSDDCLHRMRRNLLLSQLQVLIVLDRCKEERETERADDQAEFE